MKTKKKTKIKSEKKIKKTKNTKVIKPNKVKKSNNSKLNSNEKIKSKIKDKIEEVKNEEPIQPKRKYTRRKLTKEEIELALKIKAEIISENRKVFSKISKDALYEFDQFNPCDKCKFIKRGCSNACGVIMKWRSKALLKNSGEASFGVRVRRNVTDAEFYDTSSVRLGIADEVDAMIDAEKNSSSSAMPYIEDNIPNDFTSYEVSDDE